MNVDDIKEDVIPTPSLSTTSDRLSLIFGRQAHLLGKYHHIEKASGLMQCDSVPVPIHDKYGQARLKDFAWRVVEEITEATAALTDDGLETHFIEELSDALHFLVELLILADYNADSLTAEVGIWFPPSTWLIADLTDDRLTYQMDVASAWVKARHSLETHDITTNELAYGVVEYLGRAMNCLKQKPWKQTHMLTDVAHFNKNLVYAYMSFLALCAVGAKLTPDALYRIYYKKSEVNSFRQRSQY